jgi:hypothetical protein
MAAEDRGFSMPPWLLERGLVQTKVGGGLDFALSVSEC